MGLTAPTLLRPRLGTAERGVVLELVGFGMRVVNGLHKEGMVTVVNCDIVSAFV